MKIRHKWLDESPFCLEAEVQTLQWTAREEKEREAKQVSISVAANA
jgi:hypothetical protein